MEKSVSIKSISVILSLIIMLSAAIGFEATAQAKSKKSESVSQSVITGEDIIKYAKTHLGKPYSSGAKGPDAFDCSGFVYYVYKHFGYTMPCSSSEYWSNPSSAGKVISTSSLKDAQPGDIISWRNHVALYIKGNKCIEALNYGYGVTDSFPIPDHAGGNGETYRIIRVKGVITKSEYKKKYTFNSPKVDEEGIADDRLPVSTSESAKNNKKTSDKECIQTDTQLSSESYSPHIEMMECVAIGEKLI